MDEVVLSRQLFTIGKDAQIKMLNTKVLIFGLNGLGMEITKNLMLMSVKSISIKDDKLVDLTDLNSNFYLGSNNIGNQLDKSVINKLQELNQNLPINIEDRNVNCVDTIRCYDIVVITHLLPKSLAIDINNKCRQCNVKFVYCLNRGVFSCIFNDFGNDFIVNDTNGETPKTFTISGITDDIIHFIDDDFINLQEGDEVRFDEIKEMNELNYNTNGNKTFKIINRTSKSVSIGNLNDKGKYINGGIMTEVKKPLLLHFNCLNDNLNMKINDLNFTCSNKFDKPILLHLLFHALMIFYEKYSITPKSHDYDDWLKFNDIIKDLVCNNINYSNINVDYFYAQIFSYINNGELSPLDTVIGGIAAQEVLKAASNKYTPYHQFMFYDCIEILPNDYININKNEFISNTRYAKQIDIIGNSLFNIMKDSSLFLVGAGAIGCEVIKIWAMMGIATDKGIIHITDNDTIEKSNLSRQFLFRNKHLNQPKSLIAKQSINSMNSDVNIKDYQLRVCNETENIFNNKFYKSLSVVNTALDNIQARLYVDSQCVLYSIPMIEAGTMGTKGNTQIIIPFITQNYGSSRDPEEKSIPMCTLHNFPNNIHHTIQWARDRFEGLFKNEIEPIQSFKNNKINFLNSIEKDSLLNQLNQLQLIYQNGIANVPKNINDCIIWAKNKFDQFFYHSILKLITNFPKDAITDEGIPFWHAPKRFPHTILFNKENPIACQFIISASLLRASIYNIKCNMNNNEIIEYCNTLPLNPIEQKIDDKQIIEEIIKIKQLLNENNNNIVNVNPILFEKDDDLNHHVEFITACSNLRACNYCIEPIDFNQTKFISGKIIPAMITTTAVVSGLQCIELYKVLQKKPLSSYHCSFLNLAIAYMDGTEPEAVIKKKMYEGFEVSIWDKFEFNGNCTIEEFSKNLSSKYPFIIETISGCGALFYSSYSPNNQKRLKQTFKEIYKELLKKEYNNDIMIISISVTNEKDDLPYDFEFPDIILNF